MKDFKEILLEKLKVSKNINTYNYITDYWDYDILERMITFIIYDEDITDSFFENNSEEKIPELCLSFKPEDKVGNEYNGLYEYCKGKKLKEIPIEEDDLEELFGDLGYNDSVTMYYYGNNVKAIIHEAYLGGSWYYSIFGGDKYTDEIIDLFPHNLVENKDNKRASLKQNFELYLKNN